MIVDTALETSEDLGSGQFADVKQLEAELDKNFWHRW
jgi:hypothetical protein